METRPQYERGTVIIEGGVVDAIRFTSGIVHIMKSRRGVRVSRAIAKTFQPYKMKDK